MLGIQEQRVRNRRGLTLVELLVTISIMATVTSMLVVAYRSATVEAFRIRSGSTIQKISRVLTSRLQEYEFAAVPVSRNSGSALVSLPSDLSPRFSGETVEFLLHRTRLGLKRQVIMQEMPEHPDDLKWSSKWVTASITQSEQVTHLENYLSIYRPFDTGLNSKGSPVFAGTAVTSSTLQIVNRLTAIDPSNGRRVPWHSSKNGEPWDITGEPWEKNNANPELLYLIVEGSSLNGASAIELFGNSEIGDTDNDGLNEFLDAYGNPISWIRWPTSSQNVAVQHPDLLDPNLSLEKIGNDPVDTFRSDPGYARYSGGAVFTAPSGYSQPMVISPGPDREIGVSIAQSSPVNTATFPQPSFSVGDFVLTTMPYSPPGGFLFVDPWYPRGSISGSGSIDPTRATFASDDLTNFELGGPSL